MMPWPKGKKMSEETRKRMSESQQKRLLDPLEREKALSNLSRSPSRQGSFSGEHRQHLSESAMGKAKSAQHREHLAQANLGKKQSEAIRRKKSETLKRVGSGKWNSGSHRSLETRVKMSVAQAARYQVPGEAEKQTERVRLSWARKGGKHSLETIEKMKVKRSFQVTPFRDTKPELAVRDFLDSHGFKYETHRPVPGLGKHQWDFLLSEAHTLIEVDGCYWHGCPCLGRDLTERQKRQRERDSKLTQQARDAGWIVARIWEHQTKGVIMVGKQGIFENVSA